MLRIVHQHLWTVPNMSPREDSQAAVAELCTALDETSNVFRRLTDQTKAKESQLRSLPLPDDIRSLAFLRVVLKHTLGINHLVEGPSGYTL